MEKRHSKGIYIDPQNHEIQMNFVVYYHTILSNGGKV